MKWACLELKLEKMWSKLILVSLAVFFLGVLFRWNTGVDLKEFYKGKRVIVTGASRGIGRSLAIQLAALGARQVIAARTVEKLNSTADECRKVSPSSVVHVVRADVSKDDDCKAIVEKAVTEFGGLDILILNAAVSPYPQWFTIMKDPRERFLQTISTNLLQGVQLTHYSLPHLNLSNGIIVPVSSLAGQVGMPKVSAYSSSKHAINGFFKSLQHELILTNIAVDVTIMPLPFVETELAMQNWKPVGPLSAGFSADECARLMLKGIPLRRQWYYIDWTGYVMGHISSLIPELLASFIRFFVQLTSEHF